MDVRDISVIVQGAISENTKHTISNIRKILPDAEIIVSTWKRDILDKEIVSISDMIIINTDPGPSFFGDNRNRQIHSTLSGMKAARRKYALKIRTDMDLVSDGFINIFERFNSISRENPIFKNRIVTLNTHDPYICGAFHFSDFVQFGSIDDLIDLWDVPSYFNFQKYNEYVVENYNSSPERYIFGMYLNKKTGFSFEKKSMCDKDYIIQSNKFLVDNIIPADSGILGITHVKNKHMNNISDNPFTVQWMTHYSFGDWIDIVPHLSEIDVVFSQRISRDRYFRRLKDRIYQGINFVEGHAAFYINRDELNLICEDLVVNKLYQEAKNLIQYFGVRTNCWQNYDLVDILRNQQGMSEVEDFISPSNSENNLIMMRPW